MSLLDDLVIEIETYPHTYLTLEIIEVEPEGRNINAGEQGTFTLQVANSGPLDVRNLRLVVTGKHGTKVRSAGASPLNQFEPTALSNPFPLVPAHQGRSPVRMPGGTMYFEAPAQAKPETELIEVSVDTWDTDFEHPLIGHSDPDTTASASYSAEVLPRS